MYIKVRVTPKAKKEIVTEDPKGGLRISVREPALQNLANERVREIVAARYNVKVGKVRLVSGHRSPSKIISVDT